jgi:hypothetical protein
MSAMYLPVHLLLWMFAGWVNRHQLDVIEYLLEENRVLKERLGGGRLRFTDAERRRLARKARMLGRKMLNELETLVTPDTLLRWYRELVASEWNYSHRRGPGRPRVMNAIADLVVRMALENQSWGYTRIQGALANLGHEVGRGTIANILREYGVDPAPERDQHMRWSTFLRAHLECMAATDFFTVEVLTSTGLVTHYVLFFHRYRQPCREDRGHHSSSGQPVDDADGTQLHRPGRRLPSRETIFDTRPRYEILRHLLWRSPARGHRGRSTAAANAQFECFRGAVRALN